MLPFVLISLFTFFFIHFPIYSETAGTKVFCGRKSKGREGEIIITFSFVKLHWMASQIHAAIPFC
jgi:hypothetical protein